MQPRWRPSSQPLDVKSLAESFARHPVIVLHFWAAWNRIDRQFGEQLRAVRDEFNGRVFFGSIDADDPQHREFTRRCRVGNLPGLACFIHGAHTATLVGCRTGAELRRLFADWVTEASNPNPT